MEEQVWIKKAKAGDKKALEKLLYDNYHIVYGYLLKMAMNEDTAKDLTQETMVKAITNIKGFRGSSKFSSWLIAMASNAYKDAIKKDKKVYIGIEDLNLSSTNNLEETIIQRDEANQLKQVLKTLSKEKREVFILKHYYDYSYKEIADILDCPVGTVRSRLHYCIDKIQEVLKGGAENGK